MDFNALGAGQPFYVLQKSEKPVLQVGVVKSKSDPKSPYQTNQPAIFNGLATMQGQNLVVDMVVTINGADVPFSNLPTNAETSTYNNGQTFVSCSREAMLQGVDSMIQASKKVLEQVEYHQSVLVEGEKDRDRSIKSLEDRQEKTDRKIDTILEKLNELFTPSKRNP